MRTLCKHCWGSSIPVHVVISRGGKCRNCHKEHNLNAEEIKVFNDHEAASHAAKTPKPDNPRGKGGGKNSGKGAGKGSKKDSKKGRGKGEETDTGEIAALRELRAELEAAKNLCTSLQNCKKKRAIPDEEEDEDVDISDEDIDTERSITEEEAQRVKRLRKAIGDLKRTTAQFREDFFPDYDARLAALQSELELLGITKRARLPIDERIAADDKYITQLDTSIEDHQTAITELEEQQNSIIEQLNRRMESKATLEDKRRQVEANRTELREEKAVTANGKIVQNVADPLLAEGGDDELVAALVGLLTPEAKRELAANGAGSEKLKLRINKILPDFEESVARDTSRQAGIMDVQEDEYAEDMVNILQQEGGMDLEAAREKVAAKVAERKKKSASGRSARSIFHK